jgi:tripeptidyl-peptidase-1
MEVAGDFLIARLTASKAEELLQTTFYYFARAENPLNRMVRSGTDYSLPETVARHVDFVGGVKHFPESLIKPPKPSKDKIEPADFDLAVTPRFLKDQYKINSVVGTQKNNSQSVVQWLEEYFNMADLDEFFGLLLPSALGDRPSESGPNGWGSGVESSLDIEYIMSTGEHVPTLFWSNADPAHNGDPFLKWIVSLNNMTSPPNVCSVSYGEDEKGLTASYMLRVDQEFQKAGVRGVSILFASGDSGVGGSNFGSCKKFVPDFPASCPSITSVGGTEMSGFIENGKEIVNGLSGGGFSNTFPQPSYQSTAVKNYISAMGKKLPPQSYWNATGRAYPDIAALSSNFIVVVNLIPVPGVAGTSCAAPTSGGMVALLNDLRIAAGKNPLGFLNPLIYKLGGAGNPALTDITQGSNPGCGLDGFSATAGFDPASGFGSINYQNFAKVVQSLP